MKLCYGAWVIETDQSTRILAKLSEEELARVLATHLEGVSEAKILEALFQLKLQAERQIRAR